MTKKKQTKDELEAVINKGFEDWEQIFTDLKTQANRANMPLLAQSLDLDIALLRTYLKAWKSQLALLNDK